jgi:hypothetical protein
MTVPLSPPTACGFEADSERQEGNSGSPSTGLCPTSRVVVCVP